MPGPSEWLVVAIVALVVIFGAKKIPEMARSLGRAQSEFKKGLREGQQELGEAPPAPQPPAQASSAEAPASSTPPQAGGTEGGPTEGAQSS
jgi:sec-independent protein translocase protein TatA